MCPFCISTSSFIPAASGSCSIRAKSAPVMHPATVIVIPAEHEAVTQPASAPVARAIACEALRCRSLTSTNSVRMPSTISTASGTTIDAPRNVMVPETLITRRRPRVGRMSGRLEITTKSSHLFAVLGAATGVKAREECLQALVLRFLQYLIGFALNDNAAPIHEHDDITGLASKRHFM